MSWRVANRIAPPSPPAATTLTNSPTTLRGQCRLQEGGTHTNGITATLFDAPVSIQRTSHSEQVFPEASTQPSIADDLNGNRCDEYGESQAPWAANSVFSHAP